ncbi:MAG: TIGR04282 family arsenosugar biosynthesis glycosyltransferase [Deltaproteobacteria bacterium]|nr:TIGR04282 family arsenosugar biosynthesis glycosyltransferase [Deltaproteobacteria bacterium]
MKGFDALSIMLKAPRPGTVKTRLCPPLTHVQAARLYTCFIKDVFSCALKLDEVDLFAVFTPPDSEKEAAAVIPPVSGLFAQEGASLGARISNVFTRLFSEGYKRVVVIGSDSPDIPFEFMEDSFRLLCFRENTVVLGPALDGGYYLIGLNTQANELFEDIRWSGASVLEDTLEKARAAMLNIELLPKWHDVDRAKDLAFIKKTGAAHESFRFLQTHVRRAAPGKHKRK